MQALMGKNSKAPTPQEIYRARKQKEEDERNAFLPPGLVNHGNTCFMNSVLQGLIATPMLVDIIRFSLPDTYAPISSRRSPQLTNGHGVGGEAEHDWEKGMPLGDAFVHLMQKAWRIQDEKRRQSMSPKDLLQTIGTKFDQYLDFRQQDAHEFLRHLLDAMRMEELDASITFHKSRIIKQRQPPPQKSKRKNGNCKDTSSRAESKDISEEDRLASFVDMVFGGRLASVLVCEKCKKISWTYEDFNDLSLSIKQEDYEKGRKRDRLKMLARKLGMRGRPSTKELDMPNGPRSSSVPSSPLRRSEEAEKSFELILGDVGQRRRSLEAKEETPSTMTSFRDEPPLGAEDTGSKQATGEDKHLLSVPKEQGPPEEVDQQKEGSKREKDDDSWIRLRRKISVGVKKGHKKKWVQKELPPDLPNNDDSQGEVTTGDEALDSYVDVKAPSPVSSMSPLLGASMALQKFSFVRRPSSTRAGTNSPGPSIVTSPSRSPDIPPMSLPPQEMRSSSPSIAPAPSPAGHIRPKSLRPPKPTRTDSAYLRRILADIPSTSMSSSSVPFNLFRSGLASSSSSPDVTDARGGWTKFGHVQSVEECLRMFTAVEVLDGENMIKCRRCWKIQHGERVRSDERAQKYREDRDENTDDAHDDEDFGSSSSASVKISLADSVDSSHAGQPGMSSPLVSSVDLSEGVSTRSAPPSSVLSNTQVSAGESVRDDSQRAVYSNEGTSSLPSFALPSISTTAPEPASSMSGQILDSGDPQPIACAEPSVKLVSSPSQDSLQLLSIPRHSRQPAERSSKLSLASDSSDLGSDESSDEAEATETSITASIRSDSSSVASMQLRPPGLSPSTTLETLATERTSDAPLTNTHEKAERAKYGSKGKGVPRSKQVIMRRAYKRYLIATPPPVLVIHLKRFHQVGRSPTQLQFFANFKKLDDPVSFPEYLNLSPFLLPSKDEVKLGDGRRKKEQEEKEKETCMYRLFAVVVHVGNMLGGHYVAYTALPEAAPTQEPSKDEEKDASSLLTSSSQTTLDRRPEIPRTTSFIRTANPRVHSGFKSRMSSLSGSSGGAQRQWCYVSDTIVRLASLEEVLQAKAYICMYERI